MRPFTIGDQRAAYFLTMTLVGWIDLFTRDRYRKIIIQNLDYCQRKKGLRVIAYVVMSNHLHLVARAAGDEPLSGIIRDFKSYSAKQMITSIKNEPESRREWLIIVMEYYARFNKRNAAYQCWKQENHAVEVYSPKVIRQKINYIHQNPVKAGWVLDPTHYVYSSARNYIGMSGILDVEVWESPFSDEGYVHLY